MEAGVMALGMWDRTQAERKRLRKEMGTLRSLTVQPATKRRYSAALDRFFVFLKDNKMELPKLRIHMDTLSSDYLEFLWSQGEGRALASDTIAALQDFDLHLKGKLPSTWRLLKVWHTHEIPNRAPPLPEVVLRAMVGHALFYGKPLFALSLLLGFYCMLRTGELLGLRRTQVEVQQKEGPAILSLGLTKGGKRMGAAESVTSNVFDVVRRLWQWRNSSVLQLTTTSQAWRTEFSNTLKSLDLDRFEFRPYSLRRGGATFWFGKHGSLDRLLIQGRWQAARTARIYINEGMAILAETNIPVASLRPFLHVYSRSLDKTLPQLEHTRKTSRAGGRWKGPKRAQKSCFRWILDELVKSFLGNFIEYSRLRHTGVAVVP